MRIGLALAGLLPPLMLLGACTAGPDYHLPETAAARAPAAQGAFVSGREAVFSGAPLPDRWWRLYDDPRLDALVTEALAANADLRTADANLRRAEAAVREAEAGRTVATTVSGNAAFTRPSPITGATAGVVTYDLGAGVSYPVDLAGKIRRGIEAARDNAEAVLAARDDVRVTVAAATARAYADACSANRTLAANQQILTLLRQTLDVTRRLAEGGRGTAFDITRARAAVEQSEAAIPAILASRQAALYQLAALLGRAPADYPKDVERCAAPPALAKPLPTGDGAALIRRRPDIRAAERTLAAATAQIGVATADLYPQVSLGGTLGLAGPVAQIGTNQSFSLGLGPLMSWTFPNRAVTRARIAEAGAGADAALGMFDSTVLGALQQTETALSAYARARDTDVALARTRDTAAVAVDQASKLYRFGRSDFLALLDAQANLANANAALAAADAALVDQQIGVFLALGGGWQE